MYILPKHTDDNIDTNSILLFYLTFLKLEPRTLSLHTTNLVSLFDHRVVTAQTEVASYGVLLIDQLSDYSLD